MSKSKLAPLSIVCGIFIMAALTCAAFFIDNESVSGALLWQVTLIVYLIGRGPILGYDEQGSPRYEGTPLHLLILPLGLVLGCLIYSLLVYLILRAVLKTRAR